VIGREDGLSRSAEKVAWSIMNFENEKDRICAEQRTSDVGARVKSLPGGTESTLQGRQVCRK
jgi:hypothetical protein